jgi:pimeloyl-ACP methyl ester carboxylesterase
MTTHPRSFVLIPGAWMGSWVWEPVAERLRDHGHTVRTPTLAGLGARDDHTRARLQTHVDQVVSLLDDAQMADVIVVGHSYSGIVAGQVADRRPDRVAHTVFVQAFLPRNGRSLIDDWSDDPDARQQEKDDIGAAGGAWLPPLAGLAAEPNLSPEQQQWLAQRLVNHPGRTITDPAVMTRAIEGSPATYIASITNDDEDLPPHVAALRNQPTWTIHRIRGGHWPMVSDPASLTALLNATTELSGS